MCMPTPRGNQFKKELDDLVDDALDDGMTEREIAILLDGKADELHDIDDKNQPV